MDTSTLGGSLEPKLKLSTYEWDDTKSGAPSFWQFMMAFSALVRMTLYGDIFEDLLDVKCRRTTVTDASPQWMLGDPDLKIRTGRNRGTDQPSPSAKSTSSEARTTLSAPPDDDATVSEAPVPPPKVTFPPGGSPSRGQEPSTRATTSSRIETDAMCWL